MKKTLTLLLFTILGMVAITSCKKEEEPQPLITTIIVVTNNTSSTLSLAINSSCGNLAEEDLSVGESYTYTSICSPGMTFLRIIDNSPGAPDLKYIDAGVIEGTTNYVSLNSKTPWKYNW